MKCHKILILLILCVHGSVSEEEKWIDVKEKVANQFVVLNRNFRSLEKGQKEQNEKFKLLQYQR